MADVIATIVLEPRSFPRGDAGRGLMVRSLAWLVGGTVAGVIGEVVLAASADLALAGVCDAVGCRLAEADEEGSRLREAASTVRAGTCLVLLAGYGADGAAVDELSRLVAPLARLRAEPATLPQRLFPALGAMAGVVAPTSLVRATRDFGDLARASRSAKTLTTRARPLR